jgi:hypothetical protein
MVSFTTRDVHEPLGYFVALREHGRWTDFWDGEVHTTIDAAKASADVASERDGELQGWEVVVCRLVPVEDIRNPGNGDR